MEQKSPPKPPDRGDQKAMNNLMNSLQQLAENSKKQDPKTPKASPTTSKRKRKVNENYPKISTWLCKQSRKTEESKRPKPLDITVKKPECKGKKSKFERTPSFEKYGVVMPTFEKIKEDHKRLDEYKNQVKALDSMKDNALEKSFNADCLQESQAFSGEILDCKHLTLDELSDYSQKNMPILKEIMTEERFSERHQIYHKFHRKDLLRAKDLKCSPSLVVFTQEQKDKMLDLMRGELDPKDVLTNYFFQVLLPELCLLIFMECHDMSKKKASRYLDERPIDV